MFFQIVKRTIQEDEVEGFDWVYREGTERHPGDHVCRSFGYFESEPDARRDIALRRPKMRAAAFAKVC